MLVDSHCHLNCLDLTEFNGELNNVLENAYAHDVGHMLCAGIDLENFPQVLQIANTYSTVSCSVGLHPTEINKHEPTVQELIDLAKNNKVVALGETGLDYYRIENDVSWQQQRFCNHIQAALAVDKPLIVHSRQARADTIRILREEGNGKVKGVLHCFTEDLTMAEAAIELGFYISFSGIVTFKNAVELQEVAKKLPLERILIETDSPYLAPVPFRGKSNQPAFVKYVAEYIAQLRNISYEKVAKQTTENFFTLFKEASSG